MHNQSTTTLAALHRSLALARRQAQALRGQATAHFLRAQSLRLKARAMQGASGSVKARWIATQAEERAKVADEQARLAETAVDEALAKVADEQAGRAERVGAPSALSRATADQARARVAAKAAEGQAAQDLRLAGRRRVPLAAPGTPAAARRALALEGAADELLGTGQLPPCPQDVRPPGWLDPVRAAAARAREVSAAQASKEGAKRRERLTRIESARLAADRKKLADDRERRDQAREQRAALGV